MLTLTHNGVEYMFDYDFAPNTGDDVPVATKIDSHILDGEVIGTHIFVDGKRQPVPTEILGLMWTAACRAEVEHQRWELQRFLDRTAECRRARISLAHRRD